MQGEGDSIRRFKDELEELSSLAVGTLVIGDLNIHHKKWLKYSARNSAEGEELHRIFGRWNEAVCAGTDKR